MPPPAAVDQMRSVAEQVTVTGHFDAVIHNVGLGYHAPQRVETADGLAQVFAGAHVVAAGTRCDAELAAAPAACPTHHRLRARRTTGCVPDAPPASTKWICRCVS